MTNPYEIAPNTIARLERHARPFVDTLDGVINRILDVYEAKTKAPSTEEGEAAADPNIRDFESLSPPDLTHTKLLSITFNNKFFPRDETTWNSLLFEAIRLAKTKSKSDGELKRLILVNHVIGKKENEGYRYFPDLNLSVQGQDANSAWRGIIHIAKNLACPYEVIFTWRLKDGAAFPGVTGRFRRRPVRFL